MSGGPHLAGLQVDARLAAALFEAATAGAGPAADSGAGRVRRLAVIGLAKNVGKTVTLGVLSEEAARRGPGLALCSTGRDGERQDAVTELPKPAIWGPVGTLVATAEQALAQGTAAVSVLERLPFSTPFGQVVLGRVERPGTLLLVGPGTASRLEAVLNRLEELGAALSLVDGSLDRLASAAPGVTEATVVATGAALGATPADVARVTASALDILRLDGVETGPLRTRAEEAMAARPVTLLEGPALERRPLDLPTAAGAAAAILERVGPQTRAVVLGGALPAGLVHALSLRANLARQLTLIVRDSTRVFPDPLDWRRFRRLGGQVRALFPLDLRAVTCNPWSPTGPSQDPDALYREISRVAKPAPTFDVVAGLAPKAE